MRFLLFIFALVIVITVNGQAINNSKIRFNGFYQTKPIIDKKDNDITYRYVRFYSDGQVISVTSEGTALDLKNWFNIKMENPSIGKYKVYKKRIYFSTISEQGTVVYAGRVTSKGCLFLKIESLINGYKDREKYCFVEIVGLE